ncbi:MAG: hypothetical protein AAB276_00295, partial [Pseudomonadota bacterium]
MEIIDFTQKKDSSATTTNLPARPEDVLPRSESTKQNSMLRRAGGAMRNGYGNSEGDWSQEGGDKRGRIG